MNTAVRKRKAFPSGKGFAQLLSCPFLMKLRKAGSMARRMHIFKGDLPMQNLFGDIRYALRQFRLSPVFTLTAVLTLALGIGGTTAIFSLIHAVMLRSLPVADPASLSPIGDGNECCVEGGPQDKWGMVSFPLYQRLQAAAPEFEQVAAFQASPV